MSTLPGTKSRRRIYLMRHGHVDYLAKHVVASGDIHAVPLTPRGRSQAEAAGKALAHVPFDRAICSGLPRTRETAEIVISFQAKPLMLEIVPDLVEILGGKIQHVQGRDALIARMNAMFAEAGKPGATNHEGGEVFADAQNRAVKAIVGLLAEPNWQQALIAAHEGINRLVLSWASGAGLHAMGAFEQDTGCINVIDFDMNGTEVARPLIKAVNLTPYNYLKHGMNQTSLEAIFERDIANVLV